MNLPNISRFGNALILAFEPKTRTFIMGKQLARSKIDSKSKLLSSFCESFPSILICTQNSLFLLAKCHIPSILIDLRAWVSPPLIGWVLQAQPILVIGCFLTGSTYLVGVWVIIYYRQVLLPIGIAWLCEVWYRILLIGCLHLSLRCDTWFTYLAMLIPWSVGMTADPWCK